jgi:glycosyltransferase involved in cell wall biosynthesis
MPEGTRACRVAHVVETCCGGVATFVAHLIKSQLDDPAFSSVHLLHDGRGTEKKLLALTDNVSTYKSSRNPVFALNVALDVHRKLRAINPDVVILHSTFPGVWGRLFRGSWKTIYCAHGWSFSQDFHPFSRWAYERIEVALSRRCDAIVSISRDEFRVGHRAGVPDEIHVVIPHGLLSATPGNDPELPMEPDGVNLAFVGRFERQKGLDVLYDIFDDPSLDAITVWLVGDDIRGVEKRVLPARKNFRRLGWLKEPQIDAVLRQVDGLIVPSRSEGFGLVALEAMRNRKAVIASRVGGLTELIDEGVNGHLMDINDIPACRTLLASLRRADLVRMGEAAFALFEREYLWDGCYQKWRALVLRVAAA